MDVPEIPPFFICPISLQIMKDPVTLSTGMTYDRESIHRWFSYGHVTCPVTQQHLTDYNLTPNTTLCRLIESWCLENGSKASAMVEAPTKAFDFLVVGTIIDQLRKPESRLKALKKIKSLIQENDYSRRCMEAAGVASLAASLINSIELQGILLPNDNLLAMEEAISVLYALKPSVGMLKRLAEAKNGKIIESLSSMMQTGSYQARIYATVLLKSIFKVVDEIFKSKLQPELFECIVEIIKDQNSSRATASALSILAEVTPYGSNTIKAVETGIVGVLVELLLESNDRRDCEIMLGVLEILCSKAEGRVAFVAHPAAVAAVSSKILRVSQVANERASKVLSLVCKLSGGGGIGQEMLDVGAASKLCMLMQVECSQKAKDKAKEIIGLLFKTWKWSPCFPSNILP